MTTCRTLHRAYVHTAALLFACAGLAPACGGNANDTSSVSGGEGGSPTTNPPLKDPFCNDHPAGTPTCNQNSAPAQCNEDGVLVQQSPPCAINGTLCEGGHCTCSQGAIICKDGDAYECQFSATPGQNALVLYQACKDYETCSPGVKGESDAGCLAPKSCAHPGEFTCADDQDTVLHCQSDQNGFYRWVPTFSCQANGFGRGCYGDPTATTPQGMCMNECNKLGIPLQDNLCDSAPGEFCSVLVCNPDGTTLVPDHTNCFGGGSSCNRDEDCMSCYCENGKCAGLDIPQLCDAGQNYGCGSKQ